MRTANLLKLSLIGTTTLLAASACVRSNRVAHVDSVAISKAERLPASDPCDASPWEARWLKALETYRKAGAKPGAAAIQRSYVEIVPLQDLLSHGSAWLSARFGVVAADVVNREAARAGLPQAEASVIPFYYYDRFIREAKLPDGSKLSAAIDSALTDVATASDADVESKLKAARGLIEKAELPVHLFREIDGKLSMVFPDRRQKLKLHVSPPRLKSADPGLRVPDAGLIVCPADTLIGSQTSSCRGLRGPQPISRALKKIWGYAYDFSPSIAREVYGKRRPASERPSIAIFMHAACSQGVDMPGRARW